jgi:hypothetical protein
MALRSLEFSTGDLTCSWVLNDVWHANQRLELENDLIASYVLGTASVPPAQFLG